MEKVDTAIKVADKEFEITSRIKGYGVKFPLSDEKDWTLHNEFRVTACRILDAQKVCKSFNFYGSHSDYEGGKEELADEDLKFAFRSFIDDAIYGTMNFDEFCSELGYDQDSRRAEKIHKMTQKATEKTRDLGIFDSELYDIINELSEMGIE